MTKKFTIAVDLPGEEPQISSKAKAENEIVKIDETQWDNYKENIQPLKQGRRIEDLMRSLSLFDKVKLKQKLLEDRKVLLNKQLEETKDDLNKHFNVWYEYIDWLEQNFPDLGKTSNITQAIESCIEIYYDKKQFKQDKRLFNIFMKFKRFCDEPTEIFGFMYANSISILLSEFYVNWSWQYEVRNNFKRAEDILKLGVKNLATPRDMVENELKHLKLRIEKLLQSGEIIEHPAADARKSQRDLAKGGIRAALQTLKFSKTKDCAIVPINRVGAVDSNNIGGLKKQAVKQAKSNGTLKVFHDDGTGIKKIPGKISKTLGQTGNENKLPSSGTMRVRNQATTSSIANLRL